MPHFWYSEKQAEYFSRRNRELVQAGREQSRSRVEYCVIGGVRQVFTTQQAEFPLEGVYQWDGIAYLGEGEHVGTKGYW